MEKQRKDAEEVGQLKSLHNTEMDKLQKIIDEQNGIIKQYEMVVDVTKGQHVDKAELTKLAEVTPP